MVYNTMKNDTDLQNVITGSDKNDSILNET